jgi:ATP:corrinoid adenosyltransferase
MQCTKATQGWGKKVVYVVKKGDADAVYKTVKFLLFSLMPSFLTLQCDRQALQRATEWRNSIASAALSAVKNYFDYANFTSTEARQEVATELLIDLKYAFATTEEVIKNGKKRVCGKL